MCRVAEFHVQGCKVSCAGLQSFMCRVVRFHVQGCRVSCAGLQGFMQRGEEGHWDSPSPQKIENCIASTATTGSIIMLYS